MNEAEIILISGRYGVRSDSQKLAEGLAILWLLQQLDQKMPKLHLQDRHSIAIAIWIGKSKKDWKQLKRKAARAGIAIAQGPKAGGGGCSLAAARNCSRISRLQAARKKAGKAGKQAAI